MAEVWTRWGHVLVACAVAVPLVLLAAAVRVRAGLRWPSALAEVGAVAGTLPWLWMVFTPRPGTRGLELVPLHGLARILAGDPGTAVVQVVGNLLVFAAFGFCSRVRWRLGVGTVTAAAAAASIMIECLQYGLDLGRVSSVDDVLLNTAGAGLAWLLATMLPPVNRSAPDRA